MQFPYHAGLEADNLGRWQRGIAVILGFPHVKHLDIETAGQSFNLIEMWICAEEYLSKIQTTSSLIPLISLPNHGYAKKVFNCILKSTGIVRTPCTYASSLLHLISSYSSLFELLVHTHPVYFILHHLTSSYSSLHYLCRKPRCRSYATVADFVFS